MKLNYKKTGSGQPLIILHGLFGSLDNWQTLGKKFGEDFEVYLVDLRNHGKSPHSEAFNYDLMADDLYELCRELHLFDIILLGHSMGGKAAIRFAQKYPDVLDKLIVADIGIKEYPMHHEAIIEALYRVEPEKRKSRGEAREILASYIPEEGVRQFLLKNLYWKNKEELAYRFNLKVLDREMPSILEAIPQETVTVPTIFIRGSESNYIQDADFDNIRSVFSKVNFKTIDGVGHWLHAEAPERFYKIVVDFIV